jgi:hypothetical protein
VGINGVRKLYLCWCIRRNHGKRGFSRLCYCCFSRRSERDHRGSREGERIQEGAVAAIVYVLGFKVKDDGVDKEWIKHIVSRSIKIRRQRSVRL